AESAVVANPFQDAAAQQGELAPECRSQLIDQLLQNAGGSGMKGWQVERRRVDPRGGRPAVEAPPFRDGWQIEVAPDPLREGQRLLRKHPRQEEARALIGSEGPPRCARIAGQNCLVPLVAESARRDEKE